MAYDALVDELEPLSIADALEKSSAWLLSLDGERFRCETWRNFGPFFISERNRPNQRGNVRLFKIGR